MLGTHKNLDVWNLGMELAKNVYSITKHYPKSETFSLVNQMRRCAVSIVSNIAEGYGRGTNNELLHFLYVSLGSSNELDTQLELSYALSFLNATEYDAAIQLNERVNKMLRSLIHIRQTKQTDNP